MCHQVPDQCRGKRRFCLEATLVAIPGTLGSRLGSFGAAVFATLGSRW
jgi:hypothetical protein